MFAALPYVLLVSVACATAACQGKPLPRNRTTDSDQDLGPPGSGRDDSPAPPSVKDLKVKINEVMVSNTKTLGDEQGAYPAWIELHNPTDAAVDLAGVPLSDDLGKSGKWTLPRSPAAVIPAQGFLVVYCDGDPSGLGGLHANFALAPSSLMLVLNKGSDLFFFDATNVEPDVSVGRSPEGTVAIKLLASPTPGAANSEPATTPVTEAAFVRGDANGDGRVNVTDMTEILAVLFQSRPSTACLDRMDADDSGRVDIADGLRIGDALFKQGPSLAPPFPRAGADPTEDALRCPQR